MLPNLCFSGLLKPRAYARGSDPSHDRKGVLLLLFLPLVTGAQEPPAFLEITSSRNWVHVAGTLTLQARAYGEFGALLPDVSFTWQSSNPALAIVDNSGSVFGLRPGKVEIEVSSGDVSTRFSLSVDAARIEIQPSRLDLEVGQQAVLIARALDANGEPIPNSSFAWQVSLSGVAFVTNGVVRSLAPGTATITAQLLPDPTLASSAQIRLTVRPRPDFRSEPFASSDLASTNPAIRAIHEVSANMGKIAFIAGLSNGGQGAFLLQNGQLRTLAAAGQVITSRITGRFDGLSLAPNGDTVAIVSYPSAPAEAVLFPADPQKQPSVVETVPSRCCYCCLNLVPSSMTTYGDFVYGLNANGREEIWLRRPDGSTGIISAPPGYGPNSINRNQFAPAGPGRVVFQVFKLGTNGLFLWDSGRLQKLIETGDVILGKRVDWFQPPVASGSSIFVQAGGPDSSRILRYSGGTWSKVVESEKAGTILIHGPNQILDVSGETVLFEANTDQGRGIFLLRAGQFSTIALFDTSPPQTPVQFVRRGLLLSEDRAILIGGAPGIHSRIAEGSSSGAATTHLESGRVVPGTFSVPVRWSFLGASGNNLQRVVQSATNALLRVTKDASAVITGPGESLPDGSMVEFINGTASRNSRGDLLQSLATSNDQRLYLVRDGQLSLAVKTPFPSPSGTSIHAIHNQHGLNAQGQYAVWVQGQQNYEFLFFPGAGAPPRLIYRQRDPAPGGGNFDWPNSIAVDENGRVLFSSNAGPNWSLYLWDGRQTRVILRQNDSSPSGQRVFGISQVQAAGSRFYAHFGLERTQQFSEFDGVDWRPAVSIGDQLSSGATIDWFPFGGSFKVNSAGDIFFMPGWPSGQGVAVKARHGRVRLVAQGGDRILPGVWLNNVLDVSPTDSGDLFFSAETTGLGGRIVLFRATPQ